MMPTENNLSFGVDLLCFIRRKVKLSQIWNYTRSHFMKGLAEKIEKAES